MIQNQNKGDLLKKNNTCGYDNANSSFVIVNLTSTKPSCSGPISAQKTGGFNIMDGISPHNVQRGFYYSHCFSLEKNTLQ